MSSTEVAVVGASGFLGRAIVARLAARYAVTAYTRGGVNVPGAARGVATGDLADSNPADFLQPCMAVINCAARVHVREVPGDHNGLASFQRLNVVFPLALAKQARHLGARRFVQVSSVAAVKLQTADGELADDFTPESPGSAYGQSKQRADHLLNELRSATFIPISLRPPALYGPDAPSWFRPLMRAAKLGLPLPLRQIDNRRSFMFRENLADLIATVVEGDLAGAYIASDHPPIPTWMFYDGLLAAAGHWRRSLPLPPRMTWAISRIVLRDRANSLLGNAAFNGNRLQELSGWQPPMDFTTAIRASVSGRQ